MAFLYRKSHVVGDIDVHELRIHDDSIISFLNTRGSSLCSTDTEHDFRHIWSPDFIKHNGLDDKCHLNGCDLDAFPVLFSLMSKSTKGQGWRDDKNGGMIIEHDNSVLLSDLCMPHSPRENNGDIYFLESGCGTLCKIVGGKKEVVCQLSGFTRGLDFIGDYAIVGTSHARQTNIFSDIPITQGQTDCGVWIVNLKNGNIEGFVKFSGDVEELFAVQCLPYKYPEILPMGHELMNNTFFLDDDGCKRYSAEN